MKSYIKDEIERNIIRQTWGSVRSYDGILFGTVFVVGCDWKRMLNFELEVEQERFDDILQCNVKDKQQYEPCLYYNFEKSLVALISGGTVSNKKSFASFTH